MERPTVISVWLAATRPRTLAAGVAPVLVGTFLGSMTRQVDWLVAAACLAGATLIQIGSNFANDAFDGLKGADTPDRVGPQRAVASGLISAQAMLIATGIVLALAFGIGLYLATVGGWPILALGIISLVCAVAYTGGPFPLAYHGLGDLFVFLFFGLFAVLGSAWLQARDAIGRYLSQDIHLEPATGWFLGCHGGQGEVTFLFNLPLPWWFIAAAIGLQATSIIAVNNLRDIATDSQVGKRTIAVRLGDQRTRWYIVGLHITATAFIAIAATDLAYASRFILPVVIAGLGGLLFCRGMFRATGRDLNRYLARSAGLELITAAALAIALMV